jgi:hypothetical protein
MTPEQVDLESATWDIALVDAEVKLYLLAFVRTEDESAAQRLSGLTEVAARSARGWLRQVGLLNDDGSVDGARLRDARETHLVVRAA